MHFPEARVKPENAAPEMRPALVHIKRQAKKQLGRIANRCRRPPKFPTILDKVRRAAYRRPGDPAPDAALVRIATDLQPVVLRWECGADTRHDAAKARSRADAQLGAACSHDRRLSRTRTRDGRIRHHLANGKSISSVARAEGMSRPGIRGVRDRPVHTPRQHEMALRADPEWQAARAGTPWRFARRRFPEERRGVSAMAMRAIGGVAPAVGDSAIATGDDPPGTGTEAPETRKRPDIRDYTGLNPCCEKQFCEHPTTTICCSCGGERSTPEERLAAALVRRVFMRDGFDAGMAFVERVRRARFPRAGDGDEAPDSVVTDAGLSRAEKNPNYSGLRA